MGCGGSKPADVKFDNPAAIKSKPKPPANPPLTASPREQPAAAKDVKRRAGVAAESGMGDQEAGGAPAMSAKTEKTKEVTEMIIKSTAESPLFSGLEKAQFDEIVEHMFEEKFSMGETVITQGDKGDRFYITYMGKFAAYLKQVGDDKPVKEYEQGGSFGELALMYNTPRAATVRCTSDDGILYTLDRTTYRAILMAANKEALQSTAGFLKSVSLLSPLTDAQRDALSNVLVEVEYAVGDTIVSEGEVADSLFLIKSGKVGAYKADGGNPTGRFLAHMNPTQFFGESALEREGELRQATVQAVETTTMLKLTRSNFSELFGDLADLIKFNFNQKVLGTMEMFKELTDNEKTILIDALKEEHFESGVEILTQGTAGNSFYIIKSGSVTVTAKDSEGNVKTIKDTLGPGTYFGEMALLSDQPRMATVSATSATICMKLDRSTFKSLLGDAQDIVAREAETRKRELERAQRPPILMDDLKQLSILGVGTFGRVKMVLNTKDGDTPYALKCMRKGQVIALKQVEHVMNEKNLLDECNHPFLLALVATFQDEEEIYMLLELALGGELFTVLREKVKFDEKQGCFYAACVCSAFCYLHDRQIVYRDLKPENLLFDAQGYLKVVDFGFAKKITDRTWTLCGTPEYLAPEIITNKGHNLAVDWWAFGILIFEMLTSQPPFCADDPMEIYQKILRNKVAWPVSLPKTAKELIQKLLTSNPSQRLGSLKKGHRDISTSPFFAKTDWKAMLRKTCKAPFVPKISSPTDTSNFDDYDDEDGEEYKKFLSKDPELFKGF
jgi:CRP-like cAMP-binding protein